MFKFCLFFLSVAASTTLTWPLIFVEKLTLKFKGIEIRNPFIIILYSNPKVALYTYVNLVFVSRHTSVLNKWTKWGAVLTILIFQNSDTPTLEYIRITCRALLDCHLLDSACRVWFGEWEAVIIFILNKLLSAAAAAAGSGVILENNSSKTRNGYLHISYVL